MKLPAVLDKKVDIRKVNIDLIKKWVTRKITELLAFEDEVVVGYCFNMLDQSEINSRDLYFELKGFLEHQTEAFMVELWELLISAQEDPMVLYIFYIMFIEFFVCYIHPLLLYYPTIYIYKYFFF